MLLFRLRYGIQKGGAVRHLPQDVIDKTIAKYEEAYEMLTGKKL